MKAKKVLLALIASAVAVSMMAISAFAEPAPGDVEDLVDEPIEIIEEDPEPIEIIEEDPEPDPELIFEPDPEPAPEPVPSPATGNSPIAMAVIPVALAAAAIVAKKAK